MTGGKRNRLGVEKIYPTCNIGLGTTGGETAALARQRSVERLLDLKGLSGVERLYVGQLLRSISTADLRFRHRKEPRYATCVRWR